MSVPTPIQAPTAPGTPGERGRREAEQYVHQLRAFFIHAGVFIGGMVIIFTVNLATNAAAGILGRWSAWWSIWALVGWGIGLAIHGLVVRLARPVTSASTWERRQIERIRSPEGHVSRR